MAIEQGALHTSISTVVSGANSSVKPLTSGGMFIGDWESTENFSSVVCAVKSDQDGILYLEFSIDGVSADSSVFYVVPANSNGVQRQTINRKYFRAVFFNVSITNQTVLRLQTIYGHHQLLTSSLNSPVPADADALVTKSVLYGTDQLGNVVPVEINPDGSLDVNDGLSNGGVYGNVAMPLANTAYEAKIGAAALVNRKAMLLTALTSDLFYGLDNLVTSTNGIPLVLNQQISFTLNPSQTFKIFLTSTTVNGAFKLMEMP